MSATEAPTVIAPAGVTRFKWDDDESFEARAKQETARAADRAAALIRLGEIIVAHNLEAPSLDIGFSLGSDDPDVVDHDRVIGRWFASDENEFAVLVKALRGTTASPGVKSIDGNGWLNVSRRSEDVPLTLRVTMTGAVCEMVEVGTETVEVDKVIAPAKVETVTEERPVFERRCPDSLLALADVDDAGSDAA